MRADRTRTYFALRLTTSKITLRRNVGYWRYFSYMARYTTPSPECAL